MNINWSDLYSRNAAKLLGTCHRYVKDRAIAEDLMHDAFLTAFDKINTFSGRGTLEGWLHRITVNTALQYIRNNAKKNELTRQLTIEEDEDAQVTTDEKSARSIIEMTDFTHEELIEVLEQLPAHHKMVFNLYVIDGFKHHQISTMLTISEGTSKSHLARARRKIQQILFARAMERKENERKEKKTRVAWFMLLFPAKTYFIDSLYKCKFADYSITPVMPAPEILNTLSPSIHPITLLNKISTGRFGVYGFSSAGIVAVGVATLLIVKPFNRDHQLIDVESRPVNHQSVPMFPTDSIAHTDSISVIEADNTNPDEPNVDVNESPEKLQIKKPVYIHKKIIIRDTVYIQDTAHKAE